MSTPRDMNTPRAFAFQIMTCSDPACGAHIISLDRYDEPIVETVVATAGMLSMIKALQAILYEKTVEGDGDGAGSD